MGRLPCLGELLTPQKPRQLAKKSRGSRPVFLLSPPFFKSAKQELSPRSSARPIAGIDSLQPEDVAVFCWRYVRLVSTPGSQLHSSLVSPEPSHPARSRARA